MKIAIAAEAIDTTMHHNDLASPSNSEKASKRKMPLFRYIGLADMVQAVTVLVMYSCQHLYNRALGTFQKHVSRLT